MDTIDKPKKKEKAQRIDRSEGKYSEADYRALPRSEQLDLAELY